MKKHYRQMTNQEIYVIKKRIGMLKRFAFNRYHISKHAMIRMHQRRIRKKEIYRIFADYEIVECRVLADDIRVIIKSNFITSYNNNTLLSLSLLNGRLITCYEVNSRKLKNIKWSKYNKNLEINSLLQQYIYR